ncbi:MAG: hypothetical protein E6G62_02525 [Actinobacteria bacterium]|nr:MAG: hypothetical protein E6G62_02525 [Actinomycetota bacterium]
MLAYLFWHQPLDTADVVAYERAQVGFHRSLHRSPPVGLCGSAACRVAHLPWIAPVLDGAVQDPSAGRGYEDWYLVEDYAALGVLGGAAVGRGHRTAHDEAARRLGTGAGGLYALVEGERSEVGECAGLESVGAATHAVWVARPPRSRDGVVGELLGDGMDRRHASLWRRQLVLGPAPEYCLLSSELTAGVAPTRVPPDWTVTIVERDLLWSG